MNNIIGMNGVNKVKPDMMEKVVPCAEKVARQREKEKLLVPLRINAQTTILVKRENQNEEYREYWIKAHAKGGEDLQDMRKKGGFKIKHVEEKEVREAVEKHGFNIEKLTRELGISRTLVYEYTAKYGLREKRRKGQ